MGYITKVSSQKNRLVLLLQPFHLHPFPLRQFAILACFLQKIPQMILIFLLLLVSLLVTTLLF